MRVGIIGGGASGMVAAYFASKNSEVVLFERNEKLGKKIYITGKGRCNLTNQCSVEDFISHVRSNPKFLYSAIRQFSPDDTINFFRSIGLETMVERGNRVFPKSEKASDVTKVLAEQLAKNNVKVLLNSFVEEIKHIDGKFLLFVNGTKHSFDKIIICTGGCSYAATGSDGSMLELLKKMQHTIVKPVPSLVGINTVENFSLQGLTLKNISVSVFNKEKFVASEQGELLFTHTGVSGPVVLTLSSFINRLPAKDLRLEIDLKIGLDEKMLDLRLQRDFAEFSNKQFKNALGNLLPVSLISAVISQSGIDENKAVNQITAQERAKLVRVLKKFTLHVKSLEELDRAVVTAGGVDVKEISSSTLESKIIGGLYFAGEVIDIDALTGGFNLQIAFSTGFLAGTSCAKE